MPKTDQLKARIGLSGPAWQRIDSAPPVVPDHQLLRRIGQGSYGEVWLARNAVGTARAVKVVYRDSFKDARPYEREFKGIKKYEPFSRSNDGLVDVLQIGRNDLRGYFYYVMELADDANAQGATASGSGAAGDLGVVADEALAGQSSHSRNPAPESYGPKTLANEIHRRGRLPVEACLELGLTLNLALGHLHRNGLIHRDVKPSNIIFVNGVPKLADIGLVTAVEEANTFVGTEGFVPPEGPNSPQADLYALGKVLYEASMGKDRQEFPEPFTELTVNAESMELMELNTVLLKACATQPSDRYASAEEMNADLALLRGGKSVLRHHATERRLAHLKRFSLIGATLAVLVTGGWLYESRQSQRLAKAAAANLALAQRAQESAEASRQSVRQLQINQGLQAMEQEDHDRSMLWFAEALKFASNPAAEKAYRFRLGTLFRYAPRLIGVYHGIGGLLTPDEQRLVTFEDPWPGTNGVVHYWNHVNSEEILSSQQTNVSYVRRMEANWLLVVYSDDSARVMDTRSGSLVGASLRHRGHIKRAAVSPDGSKAVLGGETNEVRIWDVATGRALSPPLIHSNTVHFAAFSPDGNRIVTGAGEPPVSRPRHGAGAARVWLASTGEPLTGWLDQRNPVYYAEFSRDGRKLVTAGEFLPSMVPEMNSARVWDADTGRLLFTVGHANGIYQAVFSPDGAYLATASADRTARIWSARTGDLVKSLRHDDKVLRVAFSPAGDQLATASECLARLWEVPTGKLLSAPLRHNDLVVVVGFSASGAKLVTSSFDGLTRLWDLTTSQPVLPPFRDDTLVLNAVFSRDGQRVLTFSPTPQAQIWDTRSGNLTLGPVKFVRTPDRPLTPSAGAEFNPEGTHFVVFGVDDAARIFDAATGNPIATLRHDELVNTATFSPDGRWIITASADHSACVWDASSGRRVAPPLAHSQAVEYATFSPDGQRVVTASADGSARVWNASTGAALTPALRHAGAVHRAVFSPDGRRIATACDDGTALIWNDSGTGQAVGTVRHRTCINHVAFSPDGRLLVTASVDQTARVWDAATGRPVTPPLAHQGSVSEAWFSPDGARIITASADRTARIWDASTGDALAPPFKHRDQVRSARFSADGERALTASLDGTAQVWEAPSLDWPAQDVIDVAQLYAGGTIGVSGGFEPLSADALESRWRRLRAKYPDQFKSCADRDMAWHRRQIACAEIVQQPFAALLHLERLSLATPDDPRLGVERARITTTQLPPRAPLTPPELVDLSDYYNASLNVSWHDLNQGHHLGELPTGVQTLGGVRFDIRGLIQVASKDPGLEEDDKFVPGLSFPAQISRIQIGRKAARVHFLHASHGDHNLDGTQIGRYVVRYGNHQRWEVPIIYGEDIRDWFWHPDGDDGTSRAEVVWRGHNADSRRDGLWLRLYKRTWENPAPDAEIESIDFIADSALAEPFLIAITTD